MEIKLLTIMLLTIFSTSCKQQKLICKEIESAKINPVVMYDVSFVFNRCRARCFDVNEWKALPISNCPKLNQDQIISESTEEGFVESVNLDITACEGVAGFSIDDIAREMRPKIKRLSDLNEDICNNIR